MNSKTRTLSFFSVLILLAGLCAEARVKTGLDILVEQKFAPLAGKRVGVITNHSSQTYDRKHLIDLLLAMPDVKLAAIYVGEHGLSGALAAGAEIASEKHSSGTPIISLYRRGEGNRPTVDMLNGVDVLVYDMQDTGVRFYTYVTMMYYTMEIAAKAKIPYYVLDRPNPIGGTAEGPMIDPKNFSYVGYTRVPSRPGMTVGELARMFNGEHKIGTDLHVIEMQGWKRSMYMDETGLEWVNPSPNIRRLTAAILYPGTCFVEGSQVSVGRGTDTPFEWFGAPWLDGYKVADHLNSLKIPGVRFVARRMKPTESSHKGAESDGVDVILMDRDKLDTGLMGLEISAAIMKFHPGKFEPRIRILGSDDALARLKRGETGAQIVQSYQADIKAFRQMREKYLLYK
jgi:uncharacterized protein YbbC (DUF1343 family)